MKFKIGDTVTRDGTDIQKVIDVNCAGDLIHVECIKEPLGRRDENGERGDPWCRVGDLEWNLASRYRHVED